MRITTSLHFILIAWCCINGKCGDSIGENYEKLETGEPLSRIKYTGYQLWKLNIDSLEKLRLLNDLDIVEVTKWDLNSSNPDVIVSATNVPKMRGELKKNKVKYQVLIDDLQQAINNQPIIDTVEKFTKKSDGFNLSCYHNVRAIHDFLHALDHRHNHLKISTIGKTEQGNSIELISVISRSNNKKGIFIEGGLHAREWISPASIIYIINHFASRFHKESERIQKLDWYFLPVGNPDGYIYSYTSNRLWRKNRSKLGSCYGTDLNRNFGFHWDYGDRNPCEETFSGSQAFSEQETVAIRNFIRKFERGYWKAYISVHSYGQCVLYPYGYSKVVPSNINNLMNVAHVAIEAIKQPYKTEYTMGSIADVYLAAGVSIDWARSIGIQYSYTIELRDKGRYAFLLPAKYITPSAEELLNALRVIAESAYKDLSKKSVNSF